MAAIRSKKNNNSGRAGLSLNSGTAQRNDTLFGRFARAVAAICGKPGTFLLMVSLIVLWAVSGPLFGFSETWQLVVNTGTTIITFLMVFVIQNTQNKDTEAMQLKLDALIYAEKRAHNAMIDLEELSEEELDSIKQMFLKKAEEARRHSRNGELDDAKPKAEDLLNPQNNPTHNDNKKRPS
jgi:low affinity Fe/Cu permease